MKQGLIILLLLFLPVSSLISEIRVGDIYLERHEVFRPGQDDWFFAAPLLNALHYKTREYIIADELLFESGDLVDEDILYETERNLRSSDLFTTVRIELDSVRDDTYDLYVVTQDRWSTYPSLLFGSGGGETNWGGRFEEFNLLGTGTYIQLEGLHRTENNIGWQGKFDIMQRRLFRSNYRLEAGLMAHKYRTQQYLSIFQPYRTLDTKYSYGLNAVNIFGSDFLYNNRALPDSTRLMPFHNRSAFAWFSRAWWRTDRVFFTAMASWEDVKRSDSVFNRAYDNSGNILLAFSSVQQKFHATKNLNTYHTEDIAVGGYGSAILGKFFPIGSEGENLYYVAGHGEASYYDGKWYLFGRLIGASSFEKGKGKYTYQEFMGKAFYRITDNFLLATKFHQQTVWNWPALRQLVVDNEAGLRGYDANQLAGDNRIISNFEMRFYPDWPIWVFNVSTVAFYDVGAVWDQDQELYDTHFHNSAGLGFRFHFMKSSGTNNIYRLDFAYNFDEEKFAIVFTTNQLFPVFTNHNYHLPDIFGTEFDYE